jgi:hypothetical protein
MDKPVTIRHGGNVSRNDNGDVEFKGMQEFSMLSVLGRLMVSLSLN